MTSPGNQHCANCIGTLSFPIFVCPPTCLKKRASKLHQICLCMLPCLDPPLAVLCISGFADDVMVSHNGLYGLPIFGGLTAQVDWLGLSL